MTRCSRSRLKLEISLCEVPDLLHHGFGMILFPPVRQEPDQLLIRNILEAEHLHNDAVVVKMGIDIVVAACGVSTNWSTPFRGCCLVVVLRSVKLHQLQPLYFMTSSDFDPSFARKSYSLMRKLGHKGWTVAGRCILSEFARLKIAFYRSLEH